MQEPFLPSEVQELEQSALLWTLLLAFVFLAARAWLSWWYPRHVANRQAREVARQQEALSSTSLLDACRELRKDLDQLSADQRQEAERYSWLLRESLGRRLGQDCHSFDEQELLALAEGPEPQQQAVHFVVLVLYAEERQTVSAWSEALDCLEPIAKEADA